jgi:uncharacterized protein YdaU (DUF1376 family)
MKPPAFQFYADDFLSGTMHFSDAECGLYVRLLAIQWSTGGLPDDDAELLSYGRGNTPIARVKTKFRKCPDGLLRNDRLEAERAKQSDYRQRQADNGARGGRPKGLANPTLSENITQPITQTEPKKSSPSPSPSPIDAQTNKGGFPRLEEVKAYGAMRGLKPEDSEQFWHHFESSGWVDKNGNPVTKWQSKLMTWKVSAAVAVAAPKTNGAMTVVLNDELRAINAKIDTLANSGDYHSDLGQADREKLKALKAKRADVRKKLGLD